MSRAPIAFALDFATVDEAKTFVRPVASALAYVKIGLELFVAEGARAVAIGRELDVPVFLDLKLHDIPETVDRAVARASAHGAKLLTVHASGGSAMLERAVARAAKENAGLQIVAVTVLTSLDEHDLGKIGIAGSPAEAATKLAILAKNAGVSHFVCSPQEAPSLRAALGPEATLITPGIRLQEHTKNESSSAGDQKRVTTAGDQKRVTTPRDAILAGADILVVGRPIRDAKDPHATVLAIAKEIADARAERKAS